MSFVSLKFAAFVIGVLLVYYVVPKKMQWFVLLCASYFFYFATGFGNGFYIVFTTVSTFLCAIFISDEHKHQKEYIQEHKEHLTKEEKKEYKAKVKKRQRAVLALCLIVNFGILAFLKYNDFVISNINLFRLTFYGETDFIDFIMLPLGISFYTFQSMGYLVDVYYGKYEADRHIGKFALFVSFFPQIIQGPISRFGELSKELYGEKTFSWYAIKSGFVRIVWGLFKKLIIADRVAAYVKLVADPLNEYKGLYVLIAVFLYSMQIYADFSGGIDVSIGVAEMLGIKLTENFERPFFSKSISEYWRRWHITLGTWFKDYIFYPLSICKPIINLGKWTRKNISDALGKRLPIYLPMLAVWALTGVWHGSENRYVAWGLLNCFFIILGTEFDPFSKKMIEHFKINTASMWFKVFQICRTFWLMALLRVFDIAPSIKSAFRMIVNIFRDWSSFRLEEFYSMDLPKDDLKIALSACLVVLIVSLLQRTKSIRERLFALPGFVQVVLCTVFTLSVAIYGYYGFGYDASQFIYIQF